MLAKNELETVLDLDADTIRAMVGSCHEILFSCSYHRTCFDVNKVCFQLRSLSDPIKQSSHVLSKMS